jgi:membrane associated rhomboid family serine protease
MSTRARFLVFTTLVGIVVILFLGFIAGIDHPYTVKYLALLGAVAVYVAFIAVVGAFRKKRTNLGQ